MPLRFSGTDTIHHDGGKSLGAFDAETGERVRVRASFEVITDRGLAAVQAMASDKYDRGIEGEQFSVWVKATDFNQI